MTQKQAKRIRKVDECINGLRHKPTTDSGNRNFVFCERCGKGLGI